MKKRVTLRYFLFRRRRLTIPLSLSWLTAAGQRVLGVVERRQQAAYLRLGRPHRQGQYRSTSMALLFACLNLRLKHVLQVRESSR